MKFYRYELTEEDGEVICRCGAILSAGDEVIAVVDAYGTYVIETGRPPEDEEVSEIYGVDCFWDEFFECEDCGYIFKRDSGEENYLDRYDRVVCSSCLDDNYFVCECCDGFFTEDEVHSDRDTVVCNRCFERYDYGECYNCGTIFQYGEGGGYDEIDDESYCNNCMPDYEGIHQYSYKPTPVFHRIEYHGWNPRTSDGSEPLYMGVELEVDGGNNRNCVACDCNDDDIYCKDDSSLNYGFEMVSHPRTLSSHKSFGWKDIMRTCLDNGFKSHDAKTCGLHVHVNRNFFGETSEQADLAAGKLVLLFARFWDDFIVPFSRRTANQLTHWASKPLDIDTPKRGDDEACIIDKMSSIRVSRYTAINLKNEDTIEFRVFRGTLKYTTFIATLEFVAGICQYAKKHTLAETLDVSLAEMLDGEEFAEFATMRYYINELGININNGTAEEEDN